MVHNFVITIVSPPTPLITIVNLVTDGMQDEVMGETTSREEDCHSCQLLDAVFHAVHMSMSLG